MRTARLLSLLLIVASVSCGKKEAETPQTDSCPKEISGVSSGSTGSAYIFSLDPMVASGNPNLSPTSVQMDNFRTGVTLERLGGHGVLEGAYVDIRSLSCNGSFGAFDNKNLFQYSHSDPRFQEAMTYYYGDQFRYKVDQSGYLRPSSSVKIYANCLDQDNAFYSRYVDRSTGQLSEFVCLGKSVASKGAYYADDATVAVHELQHAHTTDNYASDIDLNQFWYDEAGAINEAVSDFMALGFLEPRTPLSFDPKLFSRWALGTFIPNRKSTRGAHLCPEYDSRFKQGCAGGPSFSSDTNTVSYIYPDGLGWPFADNYASASKLRSVFISYPSQEEIHNAGNLFVGALWDVYQALKGSHGGDGNLAYILTTQIIMDAIRHAPRPTDLDRSPVTFRALAGEMVASGARMGWNKNDLDAVTGALTARGIYAGKVLSNNWAVQVSAGQGVRVFDSYNTLKRWFSRDYMGGDPSIVTQGIATGLNDQLDPGDVAAIWFDIQNQDPVTAGGVLVDVTILDPEVSFLPSSAYNYGLIENGSSNQAHIRYGKVNGTDIVAALNPNAPAIAGNSVPTGNSYFTTNPFYSNSWTTALFVKVNPSAAHGKVVRFLVKVNPSNGPSVSLNYSTTIN